MKALLIGAAAAVLATPAHAEHWDVIGVKLRDGCSWGQYLRIVEDFNRWSAPYGYEARVGVPLQSSELDVNYWVGTSADAAKFGAAWDAWRDAQADPNSVPARLQARFSECSQNVSRHGYDVYPRR